MISSLNRENKIEFQVFQYHHLQFSLTMIFSRNVVLLLLIVSSIVLACVHRDFGNGGTVCVCTSSYCDNNAKIDSSAQGYYQIYTSSKGGDRFNVTKKKLDTLLQSEGILFVVRPHQKFQCIEGFGGTLTDSTTINMASLGAETQINLLKSYFGNRGIGYSLLRIPIGGTDFSTRPYTFADTKGSRYPLSRFNLTNEDYFYRIPYLRQAKNLSNNTVKILAAASMAPSWMKSEGNRLKTDFYSSWAEYHVRFLEAYEKSGIDIWLLSTGNKPLTGGIMSKLSTNWLPNQQRVWISQHLIPTLRKSRYKNIELITLDDQRLGLPWWIDILMQDHSIADRIKGIGVHWYFDKKMPPTALDLTQLAYPEKFMLVTEASHQKVPGSKAAVSLGSWERGENYAENIIENLNHWVKGWIDFNMVLNLEGGPNWAGNYADAPIIVNITANEFYKQPMYYIIGHFSKFIPSGSLRIGLIGGTPEVHGISFVTPESYIAIVILNRSDNEQRISIAGTTEDGFANFAVPAKSITTFLSRGGSFSHGDCR